MKELNKTKVYSLEDLTSEEKQQLLERLRELEKDWDGKAPKLQLFSSKFLYFSDGGWFVSDEIYYTSKEIINAKELFYTLDNVAVLVNYLTKEQQKRLENVFVNYVYFRKPYTKNKEFISYNGNYKHEITYDKFMELFGSEEILTLENVQVDCRYLTNEQVDEIADVFKKCGYRIGSLFLMEEYCFIRENKGKYCLVTTKDKNKTKITYSKFMELFAAPQSEVTDKPKHYSKGIDTFARMEANCTKEECLAFAKGNIDKYNWREKGQDLEDYKKIVSYANWAIKLLKDEK